MPDIEWDAIITKAQTDSDKKFKSRMSSLTTMTDDSIDKILKETGIDKENFAAVLKELNAAGKSNKAKADAITGISKGLSALVAIAAKVI